MKGVTFPEQNNELGKPHNMTDEQCYALSTHHYTDQDGFPRTISCWEFTEEEWAEMSKTRRVYVDTIGETLTPFCVMGNDPFAGMTERWKHIIELGQQMLKGGMPEIDAHAFFYAPEHDHLLRCISFAGNKAQSADVIHGLVDYYQTVIKPKLV